MRIRGTATQIRLGDSVVGIAGEKWLQSTAQDWLTAFEGMEREVALDMSDVGFVPLYEWVCTAALIERLLSKSSGPSLKIDLIGGAAGQVLPAEEYISIKKGITPAQLTLGADFELSDRAYRVAGFLESLKTRFILNNYENRVGEVYYSKIKKSEADLLSYYTREKEDENTVVLRLTRIEKKEDCKQFLNGQRIHSWREEMGARFPRSPIFESEEVWRVLCHELAVNIWEHAKVAGIIGARVVKPFDKRGLKWWCRAAYDSSVTSLLRDMRDGFLELCVADAGQGFVTTLKDSFIQHTGLPEESVRAADVLAFAFDRLGTCKKVDESWATERHALGRIHQLVVKYGGVVRLQSSGAEITFVNGAGNAEVVSTGGSIRPTFKSLSPHHPGAQMQLILPLTPFFETKSMKRMRSPLERSLPPSFRTQPDQVRGHLVPLKDKLEFSDAAAGAEEQKKFREACTALVFEILNRRPPNEPLVLDFSDLDWPEAQFETLLHLLQNVLQTRPVLLIEIEPKLAQGVEALETAAATTQLFPEILGGIPGAAGNTYGEDGDMPFLDTFRRINATVLGLDREGRKYMFGLSDARYKMPLLELMYRETSVEQLCESEGPEGGRLSEGVLHSILNPNNPTFRVVREVSGRKLWTTSWDARGLENEASRVMSRHFDDVAKRSKAWHGRYDDQDSYKNDAAVPAKKMFYLPWLAMWREDFLEASRILSRERHADEVAQRLIYRLKVGLGLREKTLDEVKVLACVTTPSMLLGAALHRWWPDSQGRPVIMDLGYYVMLSSPKNLPLMANSRGVLIIQDIVDTHRISNDLIKALREQGAEILGVLSFVQLRENLTATRATSPVEGWLPGEGQDAEHFTPRHALIEVRRPRETNEPVSADGVQAFWIEQRSLRPVPYSKLRREREHPREGGRSYSRRDECLERFDTSVEGPFFSSGHYVYGRRHYALTVDIRNLLRSEIGDEIAMWLADVCSGNRRREEKEWERSGDGRKLEGDVTAVLMPLHSQIHYIWPRIENLLAQRGRRQPNWWLEATLFTGAGPAYFLPRQFTDQISQAVEDAISSVEDAVGEKRGGYRGQPARRETLDHPLRILVIDDAIATGRTAETILATVLKVVEREFKEKLKGRGLTDKSMADYPSPLQWIRYFALLNQMGESHHKVLHSIPAVGKLNIPVVFEEFAPFMGVPVYDEETCPTCRDISRLNQLSSKCERYSISPMAQPWVTQRLEELKPIAVDSPDFRGTTPVKLSRPIDVLAALRTTESPARYLPWHADTAIWRFYELMYLSYPPNDVLRSLDYAWSDDVDAKAQVREYERFRWSVFEWCLHNWARIRANAARETFEEFALKEVEGNTGLVERILEGTSVHHRDSVITHLVSKVVDHLVELEAQRESEGERPPDWRERVVRLYTALTIFFFNVPKDELDARVYAGDTNTRLLDYLSEKAQSLNPNYPSHARNLHHFLTQPRSFADPKWALERLAEAIFRGRDPKNAPAGNHKLLPRLIADVKGSSGTDIEKRGLLSTSLAVFSAALENIKPYAHTEPLAGVVEVEESCKKISEWLKLRPDSRGGRGLPDELTALWISLQPQSEFITRFNKVFHEEVGAIGDALRHEAAEKGRGHLEIEYVAASEISKHRVLIDVDKLKICLANLAIDPVVQEIKKDEDGGRKFRTRIAVSRAQGEGGEERIKFRLLTHFTSLEEASARIEHGVSGSAERAMLAQFGATFKLCEPPGAGEERFTTACEVSVLAGYIPH